MPCRVGLLRFLYQRGFVNLHSNWRIILWMKLANQYMVWVQDFVKCGLYLQFINCFSIPACIQASNSTDLITRRVDGFGLLIQFSISCRARDFPLLLGPTNTVTEVNSTSSGGWEGVDPATMAIRLSTSLSLPYLLRLDSPDDQSRSRFSISSVAVEGDPTRAGQSTCRSVLFRATGLAILAVVQRGGLRRSASAPIDIA